MNATVQVIEILDFLADHLHTEFEGEPVIRLQDEEDNGFIRYTCVACSKNMTAPVNKDITKGLQLALDSIRGLREQHMSSDIA